MKCLLHRDNWKAIKTFSYQKIFRTCKIKVVWSNFFKSVDRWRNSVFTSAHTTRFSIKCKEKLIRH